MLPLPLLVFDMGVIVRGDDRLSTAAEVPSLPSSSMSRLCRLGFNAAILRVHTFFSESECEFGVKLGLCCRGYQNSVLFTLYSYLYQVPC